jgi:hypothetical protein
MPSARLVKSQRTRNDWRSIYEQAMGRLRAIGALGAVLIALIARTVIDGLTVAGGLAEALIVVLLTLHPRVSFAREAVASAGGQCKWPVVNWETCRPDT